MGSCLDSDIDPKILITPSSPPPPEIFSLKGGVKGGRRGKFSNYFTWWHRAS